MTDGPDRKPDRRLSSDEKEPPAPGTQQCPECGDATCLSEFIEELCCRCFNRVTYKDAATEDPTQYEVRAAQRVAEVEAARARALAKQEREAKAAAEKSRLPVVRMELEALLSLDRLTPEQAKRAAELGQELDKLVPVKERA